MLSKVFKVLQNIAHLNHFMFLYMTACQTGSLVCLNIDKILRNVTASQLGSGINLAYALYRETAKT